MRPAAGFCRGDNQPSQCESMSRLLSAIPRDELGLPRAFTRNRPDTLEAREMGSGRVDFPPWARGRLESPTRLKSRPEPVPSPSREGLWPPRVRLPPPQATRPCLPPTTYPPAHFPKSRPPPRLLLSLLYHKSTTKTTTILQPTNRRALESLHDSMCARQIHHNNSNTKACNMFCQRRLRHAPHG